MPTLSTIGAACARAWGFTSGLVKDQYFNLVSLLLPGNGTNGAQNNTFLDSGTANSGSGFTITRNGNTTQGTFSPFSQTGWGNRFDGATSTRLTLASSSDFAFGTGAYTIEAWVYITAFSSSGNIIFDSGNASGSIALSMSNTGGVLINKGGTGAVLSTSSSVVSLNAWNHIAASRVSTSTNETRIFVNGVLSVTGTDNNNWTVTTDPSIGGINFANYTINGWISNLSVLKGTAKYTAAFTPSVTPLPTNTANQVLLTCQANRFIDSNTATTAKTITVSGSPSVTPFSPFAPTQSYSAAAVGGSGYFDGTGDYLVTQTSTAFQLSTSNFSIEFWSYYLDAASSRTVCRTDSVGTSSNGMLLGYSDGTNIVFYATSNGSAWDIANGPTLTSAASVINRWTHFAYVRNGSTLSVFVNGSRVYTTTTSAAIQQSGNGFNIGTANASSGATNFNGYLSGFRYIKGTTLPYDPTQTTITVPTSPVTAVTDTQLLLNFTNAGVVDATAKNVLETVGNAQISTTQSKWGGGSISFDGTADALRIPDDEKENLRFGTGNFTIEFWAWKSANGSMDYDTVISIGSTGSYNGGFSVELSASRGFCFIYDNAVRIQSNFNPNDSTWNHYAVVRDGSTFALYKNGSRLTTATLTPTLGITGTAYVGAGALTDNSFNGYIDDLRVSKGLARYTGATYTTPTAPFPVQ